MIVPVEGLALVALVPVSRFWREVTSSGSAGHRAQRAAARSRRVIMTDDDSLRVSRGALARSSPNGPQGIGYR